MASVGEKRVRRRCRLPAVPCFHCGQYRSAIANGGGGSCLRRSGIAAIQRRHRVLQSFLQVIDLVLLIGDLRLLIDQLRLQRRHTSGHRVGDLFGDGCVIHAVSDMDILDRDFDIV